MMLGTLEKQNFSSDQVSYVSLGNDPAVGYTSPLWKIKNTTQGASLELGSEFANYWIQKIFLKKEKIKIDLSSK